MTSLARQVNESFAIKAEVKPEYEAILTADAVQFVVEIAQRFEAKRQQILADRIKRQAEFDKGALPDFLPETKQIRESEWKVAPIPADLLDRRVEITGPVERKMIINALNSGAKVFMADFEDSLTPTFDNVIQGQINLRDAINRTITYTSEEGKSYKLNDKTAVLIVRPRGWHLNERHAEVDGKPVAGAFLDFALYFYHNHKKLLESGTGPYFYLPKLEGYKEAELWRDIFNFAEDKFALKRGTIKATVLVEVITAVYEMEEILYTLKDYIVALNCGRWDYIYSYIKKFNSNPEMVLPDRGSVTMTVPFLRAYSKLLIKTCHKRGAFAMGGMSAFIPIKNDPEKNDKAIAAVKADKEREAGDGHDGTWVAHPGLVPVAMEVFERVLGGKPNQKDLQLNDFTCSAADLIATPAGEVTEAGLRNNISVSLRYIESWLRGSGCVPIFNLMEDAATAEISRSQVWQWLHYPKGKLATGEDINQELVKRIIAEEIAKIREEIGADAYNSSRYADALGLFEKLVYSDKFTEFLTLPAYEAI